MVRWHSSIEGSSSASSASPVGGVGATEEVDEWPAAGGGGAGDAAAAEEAGGQLWPLEAPPMNDAIWPPHLCLARFSRSPGLIRDAIT